MKATELLEQQHREVEDIFERIEKDDGDRSENLRALASTLASHMRIEEEIFYPRAREIQEEQVLESLEEHTVAAFALKRLVEIDPEHSSFVAKAKALKDIVMHHIEEEENEMFPRVERAIGERELESLADELKARFEEVVASGYGADLVRGAKKRDGAGRRAPAMHAPR